MVKQLWKTIWGFLQKLKIELPYNLAIPCLGIYPKELKSGSGRDVSTPMFIAVLFTTAIAQPKYQSANEWIRKCGILFSIEKEGNSVICDNMGEP